MVACSSPGNTIPDRRRDDDPTAPTVDPASDETSADTPAEDAFVEPRNSRRDGSSAHAAPEAGRSGARADSGAYQSIDAGLVGDAASPVLDAQSEIERQTPSDAGGDGLVPARPFPPFEATGEPLSAPDRTWTYVEFSDTVCRNGSPSGLGLWRNQASSKLMIYLEGAVYCFDDITCLLNADRVDDPLFNSAKTAPTTGIFELSNPENPIRDWNIVYVPNCTGDGHGGTKQTPTDVPNGPEGQYFAGQANLEKFLQRIVPTFPDASDVLFAGTSSGGFGVLQNLVLVQRAFPKLKVRHVNDGGPPLSKAVIAECLQDKMRTLWGLDDGALAWCAERCPNRDDHLLDNALFLAETFADRPGGFISAAEDEAMAMFYGLGLNDCTGTFLFDSVAIETFRADLLAYRDKLQTFSNYGTFIAAGTQHTFLRMDNFYTETAGGVKMVDWFAQIANGEAPGHVGP